MGRITQNVATSMSIKHFIGVGNVSTSVSHSSFTGIAFFTGTTHRSIESSDNSGKVLHLIALG